MQGKVNNITWLRSRSFGSKLRRQMWPKPTSWCNLCCSCILIHTMLHASVIKRIDSHQYTMMYLKYTNLCILLAWAPQKRGKNLMLLSDHQVSSCDKSLGFSSLLYHCHCHTRSPTLKIYNFSSKPACMHGLKVQMIEIIVCLYEIIIHHTRYVCTWGQISTLLSSHLLFDYSIVRLFTCFSYL